MSTLSTPAFRFATEETYRSIVLAVRETQPDLSDRAFAREVERLEKLFS